MHIHTFYVFAHRVRGSIRFRRARDLPPRPRLRTSPRHPARGSGGGGGGGGGGGNGGGGGSSSSSS
eukprot:12826890-Heterocapsa_arctica.AAC.1